MKRIRNVCGNVLACAAILLAIVSALAHLFSVRDPQIEAFLLEDGFWYVLVMIGFASAFYGMPKPLRSQSV